MAFLEEIIKAFDGCFYGSLEVATVFFVVFVTFRIVRQYHQYQRAREKLAHDPKAHVKKPIWGPTIAFAVMAAGYVALVIIKYTR